MYPTDPIAIAGLWSSLLLMLMIYSYPLYKENLFFRFAEHTYIAVAAAITLVSNYRVVMRTALVPMMEGTVLNLVPILLGLMMYSIFIKNRKYVWVSRYPIALLIGSSIGLAMRAQLIPNILIPIKDTITLTGNDLSSFLNFSYLAIATFCSISYFLLTKEHKGVLKYPTRLGRLFIMLALGAMFGNTVLMRMGLISARVQFLLQVLGIIPM